MELSTPVIIGIVVLVLVILIVLIVLGVLASKRKQARQQEADRLRAAELRDEAKSQETAVQERDLNARETELEADRSRLEAERKAKEAEQEQITAERRRADAEKERAAVEQDRSGVEERLAEADRLDPDTPDAPRRAGDGAPIAADSRHEPVRDDHGVAHADHSDHSDRGVAPRDAQDADHLRHDGPGHDGLGHDEREPRGSGATTAGVAGVAGAGAAAASHDHDHDRSGHHGPARDHGAVRDEGAVHDGVRHEGAVHDGGLRDGVDHDRIAHDGGPHDGSSHDRIAHDDALADDSASAGHGRRAARPVNEEPLTGDAPDRTPGAADAGDTHVGPDHRTGAAGGAAAAGSAGHDDTRLPRDGDVDRHAAEGYADRADHGADRHHPVGPDHADARHGGYADSTGRIDGSPEQQTPPADQQFGRPPVQDGRQTPPADQQFGRPEGRDPQLGERDQLPPQDGHDPRHREGDRVDEQDPFFQQQQQLREDNGELPPKAPEFRDPQDGSHRG